MKKILISCMLSFCFTISGAQTTIKIDRFCNSSGVSFDVFVAENSSSMKSFGVIHEQGEMTLSQPISLSLEQGHYLVLKEQTNLKDFMTEEISIKFPNNVWVAKQTLDGTFRCRLASIDKKRGDKLHRDSRGICFALKDLGSDLDSAATFAISIEGLKAPKVEIYPTKAGGMVSEGSSTMTEVLKSCSELR